MTEKIAVDLGNVQKTLFLPLWGRAVESAKAHPMLVDKTAQTIVQAVDIDFASMAKNISEMSQVAWITRCIIIDEAIRAFLTKYPQGTIINIGCGLDTTFERVDNGTLTWYDLDLPDVIALRRRFIQESGRRKFIAASFLESDWLRGLEVKQQVFFFAAGVLYYFEEQAVREFLVRLADQFPGCELLMDVCSPLGVRMANRMVIKRTGLDERSFLKWGLTGLQTLTGWDRRFQVVRTQTFFGKGDRFLSLKTRPVGWVSDLIKAQYMLHMRMMVEKSPSPEA